MKQTFITILTALLLCVGLLALAIYIPVMGNYPMLPLMRHYAPPVDTHLPAAEYEPVVEMITDYLTGRTDAFQHIFTMDGAQYAAFNQKEQQHMADVQWLFGLCRVIAWVCNGVVIFAGATLRRAMSRRIFRRTLLAVLAAVTVIILLAVIDFDGLFILFHKVAFTNDLWLLDPSTDLLIRLMPIEFFISYAAIIGGIWLLGMTAMLIFATVRIKKMQTKEGE